MKRWVGRGSGALALLLLVAACSTSIERPAPAKLLCTSLAGDYRGILDGSFVSSVEDRDSLDFVVELMFGTRREFVDGAPEGTEEHAKSVRAGVQRYLDREELSPAEIDAYVADFDELKAKAGRECAKNVGEG